MKTKDTNVVRSSGNVFADIGLPDAEEHRLKADIAVLIGRQVNRLGLTQSAAAVRLGLAQPDVSRILNGQLGNFSLARLLEILRALGNDIEIKIKPAKDKKGGRFRMIA